MHIVYRYNICSLRYYVVEKVLFIIMENNVFQPNDGSMLLEIITHNFALNMTLSIAAVGRNNCKRLLCKWNCMFLLLYYIELSCLWEYYVLYEGLKAKMSYNRLVCWLEKLIQLSVRFHYRVYVLANFQLVNCTS